MKVRHYPSYREASRLVLQATPAVDRDFQGGLEEQLMAALQQPELRHLEIELSGLVMLHATLTAALLSLQIHMQRRGGSLTIAGAPWFVHSQFRRWGIADRFVWSEGSRPLLREADARQACTELCQALPGSAAWALGRQRQGSDHE